MTPVTHRNTNWVHFDAKSEKFDRLAGAYRKALARAERLWQASRRLETRPPKAMKPGARRRKEKDLVVSLASADVRLERAREALQAHVRSTFKSGPWWRHRK